VQLVDRCPWGAPGGDGKIDAGELVDVFVEVVNSSSMSTATGVRVSFSNQNDWILPSIAHIPGPDIPPDSSVIVGPFTFLVDPMTPCGTGLGFDYQLSTYETGRFVSEWLTADVDLNCQVCQRGSADHFLYRSTVLDTSAGWKQLVPLPLTSTSTSDPGWPRAVSLPGSQDDWRALDSPWPMALYRVLNDLDEDQGNVLRAVRSGNSLRVTF